MDNVIPIEVTSETAKAFARLSAKDQKAIKRSMRDLIESVTKSPIDLLLDTMRDASEQARQKGLTPEELSKLLLESKHARRP